MKVSVIVPVYNAAPDLLGRCLSSVAVQEDVDVETVVVDDGSRPDVAASCEELLTSSGCSGFVVHQGNKGLSGARNTGVDAASGDWVYFLDSDDHLADATSICRFCSRAEETGADVVVGRFYFERAESFDVSPAPGRDWLLRCLLCGEVSFAAPDTLYQRVRCLEERFELGLVHEDEDFSPRLLFGSRLVAGAVGGPTYVRVPSEGSITTAKNEAACFRRRRGKLIVSRNTLADDRFRSDADLWALQQARAFGFANMAFKGWARDVRESALQDELSGIAAAIDYDLCALGRQNGRNLRTWACMRLVRAMGPSRYSGSSAGPSASRRPK